MPTYEYHCIECGHYFDVKATVKEKEEGLHLRCEKCGSENLQQVFAGLAILSSGTVDVRSGDANKSGGGCCDGSSGSGCC